MLLERQRGRSGHPWVLPAALGAAVVVLFALSLAAGPAHIPLLDSLAGLADAEPGVNSIILREIRLPRSILALTVGATLGLSGAALQGLLRNPLAEPGLIGVSATAAFGSVVIFYFGLSATYALALPLGGIAGALFAIVLLYSLAGREAGALTLILSGVAVSSFAAALTSLALNLAPSPYAAMKLASESLASSYYRCYGTPFAVIRFSNVYGRYDHDMDRLERAIWVFRDRIAQGAPVTVFGADKVLDFTYIDDAVAGIQIGRAHV